MPIVDLATIVPEPEILKLLPSRLVFRQHCVPIDRTDGVLRVATSDPFELTAFDELRLLTGLSIELVLADEEDLRTFIRRHYGVAGDTLEALEAEAEPLEVDAETSDTDQAELASVIRLVNDLLIEAIRDGRPICTSSPMKTDSPSATASMASSPRRACRVRSIDSGRRSSVASRSWRT
jgi:type IV pilus assembly protein PilB